MSTASLQSEIKKAFADVGLKKVDKDTMSKCVAVASALRLSPNQMATCWEAFKFNRNSVTTLNESCFAAYRAALVKESDSIDVDVLADNHNNKTGAIMTRPRVDLPNVTPPAKRFHAATNQPTIDLSSSGRSSSSSSRRVSLSPGPPVLLSAQQQTITKNASLPKYSDRQGVGKVVAIFNPHNLDTPPPAATNNPAPRCSINVHAFDDTNVTESYRHMYTSLHDRAAALDRQLVQLGECMVQQYNLHNNDNEAEAKSAATDVAPLEAVGMPRQDKICCIGRICNSAHEGHMNATSVLLEGPCHTSGGARVELDLSHLVKSNSSNSLSSSSYSLFPGQIVAVEGMNTTGRRMVVHRICEGAAPDTPTSTVQELLRYHYDERDGKPVSIMAVAGPFATSDDLDYQPLVDLLERETTKNPDVVILMGPFVDTGCEAVQTGQTTLRDDVTGEEVIVPYDTFFACNIAVALEELCAKGDTQFVLVPSLDDANAEWVYPQPPMKDRIPGGCIPTFPGADEISIGTLGLDGLKSAGQEPKSFRRVHCVPNPCTLKINEMVVGVTSTDALFHISADETNANLEPGSRLVRISQHMIQQRSYYPLFPPREGVNLNLKRMHQWSMPCKPDILIVPSKLTPFCKSVLESTVVVNPGRLTQNTTGGTYAMIDVHPFKRETLENAGGDNVELPHAVHQRALVEIKRI